LGRCSLAVQSLIMFLVTLLVGFQQRFSWLSKVKTIVLGLIGTIFVNIFRIVMVIMMFLVFGRVIGLVIHDYAALLTNTLWFITFWWFSYAYILENKNH
jgi:exosortase/archaeosortase family protein